MMDETNINLYYDLEETKTTGLIWVHKDMFNNTMFLDQCAYEAENNPNEAGAEAMKAFLTVVAIGHQIWLNYYDSDFEISILDTPYFHYIIDKDFRLLNSKMYIFSRNKLNIEECTDFLLDHNKDTYFYPVIPTLFLLN